jgi:acetoin utilization protein AcuB
MIVGRRMKRDPETVASDAPLTRAADLMRRFGFNHLPVVEGGRLVGILSDTDLRNAFLASEGKGADGKALLVRDVMREEVWSVTPEDSLEDALLIISRQRFGALPVLSGDRLVGIITKIDLLEAFIDILNIHDVCLCTDVALPPDLGRFKELMDALAGMGVEVRSAIVTPDRSMGIMVAHLRLATIDGRAVKEALKGRGFELLEPAL